MDEMTLTLNSPITEEQWDAITDVDFEHTNEISFHTKHGKIVKFVKVSAQPEQRWIPVTERPPLKSGYYLCSYKDGCVISTFWTGGSWYGYETDDIIAWMTLPKPWRGEEDDCK